jgi:hypothetical protein
MKQKAVLASLIAIFVSVCLVSLENDALSSGPVPTDYSKAEHWLAVPVVLDKKVDVFYLYPTSWRKVDKNEPDICPIDNPLMLKWSKAAFGRQATAFETVGNMFAPYYRQVDLTAKDREEVVGTLPTLDAVAAFDYYVKHFNNGRPFILAGHSQGANVLSNLLAGYLKEHPDVCARMVAAYVIGYSVTGEYLSNNPHLKFAQGPDDTGVIISYNTEAPGVVPGTNPVVSPGGIAINPITWTRDETPARASQSLGSIMPSGEMFSPVEHYADARVDKAKGVVICSTADADKLYSIYPGMGKGIYHSFDFPFYYYNLRENAANRIEKFLGKQ